jgi:acyl-CoA synthetase (AMP-forming)/AMP-acid ligase II
VVTQLDEVLKEASDMERRFILRELSRYKVGTYADIVYRNALLYSKEEAFKCGPETLTFAEYNTKVNQLIHALFSIGVNKGDVLGILSWNCLEYPVVYGAAMKGGFIASPFNPRLKEDELDYIINYSEANTLFIGPELLDRVNSLRSRISRIKHFVSFKDAGPDRVAYKDLLNTQHEKEPDVQVEEEDPLFIFYTSGTTGVPRGALYDHSRAMDDTRRCVISLGLEHEVRQIQVMPLFHVGGTKNFWAYFFVGGGNVIMPQVSFDPSATLKTIQDEKATDIHIVPTHLAAFLDLPEVDQYDLSSLKRMFYAASPMPLELLKKGMAKWGPIFVQGYGSSEDGPNVTTLSRQQHNVLELSPQDQRHLASAGFPHIGVHVRIVDDDVNDLKPGEVGEIIVQSKGIMQELWRLPDETHNTVVDGWVHTGDMGRYDEQGYIYVVDRKKDMIISGGENIFPREIEEILYQHAAIVEAAVIGIPDPYWVEKVHAVVVLKEGTSTDAEELVAFCKDRLASYKAPKSVEFVATLPKNPAGKILKRQLREKCWEGTDRKI